MKRKLDTDDKVTLAGLGLFFSIIFATIAGYITHLFWAFETLMNDVGVTAGQFFLIVIGTFMPPIGVIHGFFLWFM